MAINTYVMSCDITNSNYEQSFVITQICLRLTSLSHIIHESYTTHQLRIDKGFVTKLFRYTFGNVLGETRVPVILQIFSCYIRSYNQLH